MLRVTFPATGVTTVRKRVLFFILSFFEEASIRICLHWTLGNEKKIEERRFVRRIR